MPTPSPKLGLALPSQSDDFSTADIRGNWEKIDASPGAYVCTSTTRPTTDWTPTQGGRRIYETDTGLEWTWDGANFSRTGSSGLLKCNDGSWAIGERTTDFTTSSTSLVKAVTLNNVKVPAGRRPLRIDVSWLQADNPGSNTHAGAILRSNTANSGPVESRWQMGRGMGGGMFAIIRNGLAPGSYDWSFQVNAPSNTTTISATPVTPISIFVTEL